MTVTVQKSSGLKTTFPASAIFMQLLSLVASWNFKLNGFGEFSEQLSPYTAAAWTKASLRVIFGRAAKLTLKTELVSGCVRIT